MYIRCTLGAIFIIFILCVHCDNAANYNESKKIYVPPAPQHLTVNSVTSEGIHLSWAPPTTYTHHEPKKDLQGDEPRTENFDWYKKDQLKHNDEYSSSDILNGMRKRRDLRSHRHRKRRQDNATETKSIHAEHTDTHTDGLDTNTNIEIVEKSFTHPHKDATQIAYVLYYEQGQPKTDAAPVLGVPSSADVKKMNYFSSDLTMADYSEATKNVTLLNTAGKLTKVVGFHLRNLKPFTPYKIWVRAFYSFSLDGVKSSDLLARLGPQSTPLYVLTDVKPPSAPIITNLTCDQLNDVIYLQWRQPLEYNNTLDRYVVTFRKIPELQPRTRLHLTTSKADIETTISVSVKLWNAARYEMKIYAGTLSVARPMSLVDGATSEPKTLSPEWCTLHEARAPSDSEQQSGVKATILE